jgi:hypothetical protein
LSQISGQHLSVFLWEALDVGDEDLLEPLVKLSHVKSARLICCIGCSVWSALAPALIHHSGGRLVQGHGGQGVPIPINAHHDEECNLTIVLDLFTVFAVLGKEGIFST